MFLLWLSKHFFFPWTFPSSHMLNLVIYNCEGAMMCFLDASLEKKTCHPSCWEYCQQSTFFRNCLSQEIHLAHGHISLRFKNPALLPWLRTALRACSASHSVGLCESRDCSLPGSSVHEMFQARIREWVAISFSRRSSQPRDWTQVSTFIVLTSIFGHISAILFSVFFFGLLWFFMFIMVSQFSLFFPLSSTFFQVFYSFFYFSSFFFNGSIFVPKYYVAGVSYS